MNIYEGASRLVRAGVWIASVLMGVNGFLFCRTIHVTYYRFGLRDLDRLDIELIALAIPGALRWLTGWILEGFVKEAVDGC